MKCSINRANAPAIMDAQTFAELTEEMLGNPQSVLTKITPERFRRLMEQVKHLNINTSNGSMVPLMSEPASSATCANMCRELVGVSFSHPSWMYSKQLPDTTIYLYSLTGVQGGLVTLQATLEWEGGYYTTQVLI